MRVTTAVGWASAVIALLSACGDDKGWNPPAQFAPSLQPVIGLRDNSGALDVWTGRPCTGVTRLVVLFDMNQRLELSPSGAASADVSRFTLRGPYPGFQVTEGLPEGFDWSSAESVSINIDTETGDYGTTSQLASVVSQSADQPAGVYYFDDVGWLDEAGVAERNGRDFLAGCTPDPAQK